MAPEADSLDHGGLRDLWTAYVLRGGCMSLDELDEVVQRGTPLPAAELALLTTARADQAR